MISREPKAAGSRMPFECKGAEFDPVRHQLPRSNSRRLRPAQGLQHNLKIPCLGVYPVKPQDDSPVSISP